MNHFISSSTLARRARRVVLGASVGALLALAAPLAAGATTPAPSIDSVVVAPNGDVTATWTLNVPDATSIDVILYDANGSVVRDDTLSPTATSDTLTGATIGTGYYVVVSATDPSGTTSSAPSTTVDVTAVGQPVVTGVSASGGNVTVNWTNTATDATGIDVILYDANGNVVSDDALGANATSDTFTNVTDANGYNIVVVAHTPEGDVTSNASETFDLVQGSLFVDNAPVITTIVGANGDVTVTWTNNAPSATGQDVVLYDANGNVITDLAVGASVGTATFTNVPDGGGYSVVVTAHTPNGDLTSNTSNSFDVYQGAVVQDQAPVIVSTVGANGDVTVTWTNGAPDATSIEVIVYDANGNIVADDTLGANATSDTVSALPDAQGYTYSVVAHTPGGDLAATNTVSFSILNGSFTLDQPVQIDQFTCTNGVFDISWSSYAADATGYDVTVTDANGNVVAHYVLGADATSDSFSLGDGSGYSVTIVAHTPLGDLTTTTANFTIANGSLQQIPVDPIPVIDPWVPVVVDPSSVTLTHNADGTWTVSWPEVNGASTAGFYFVTTDQGESCSVDSTGVAGATISCDLGALSDPSAALTGLNVTYEPHMFFDSLAGVGALSNTTPVVAYDHGASNTTPTPKDRHAQVGTALVANKFSANNEPAIVGVSFALLVAALAAMLLRRRSVA